MAKSIHLSEMALENLTLTPTPHGGTSFWEHWFETQSRRQTEQLDEHGIWEKAVNFEILAMDNVK